MKGAACVAAIPVRKPATTGSTTAMTMPPNGAVLSTSAIRCRPFLVVTCISGGMRASVSPLRELARGQ